MAERDLTSNGVRGLLSLSVLVLLSCGVGNVLLAITESVLWPVIVGVAWTVTAALVAIEAEAATPSTVHSGLRSVRRVSSDLLAT